MAENPMNAGISSRSVMPGALARSERIACVAPGSGGFRLGSEPNRGASTRAESQPPVADRGSELGSELLPNSDLGSEYDDPAGHFEVHADLARQVDDSVEKQIREAMVYGEPAIRFAIETLGLVAPSRERDIAREKLQEALFWLTPDNARCLARLQEALFWEREHQRVTR